MNYRSAKQAAADGYRTASGWKDLGRVVLPDAVPVGITRGMYRSYPIYSLDQTRPIRKNNRLYL